MERSAGFEPAWARWKRADQPHDPRPRKVSNTANSLIHACCRLMTEFSGEVRASPPSLLRSFGAAPVSLTLHRGTPRRSASEGRWRRERDSNPRNLSVFHVSSVAPSTARPPLPGRARARAPSLSPCTDRIHRLRPSPPRKAAACAGPSQCRRDARAPQAVACRPSGFRRDQHRSR